MVIMASSFACGCVSTTATEESQNMAAILQQKWIGNQKRKRMQESGTVETEQDVTLKRIKGVRGPNSYNLFCADFFKTGECKGLTYQEKNKRASEKWKEQNDSQRKKFVDSAKVYKELNVKVSELTDDQRKKLINRHRKKLLEEILVLEDLGCQTASMHLDVGGEVYNLGSKGGTAFLAINADISIKFREYFGGNNQHFTIAHVQDLFNKKYSDACGKPCKVPYLKGGFEVHGLPEGIQFKKPYSYGRSQLKQIMLHADKIHFTITSNSSPATSALPPAASASPPTTPSLPLTTPTLPPSTSTLPPATSTLPPATSTFPPATSTLPPATSTLPHATSTLPPATSTLPPATSTLPPATSTLPPATFTLPPATSSLPLTTPTLPPSTSTLPPATSSLPPATSTFPSATSTFPSVTSTFPSASSTLPPATFILPSALTDTNTGPALTSTESNFASTADIKHVLAKIAGADAMQRALDGGKIEEEEVEVVDLCLSAAEKLTLYASCWHYFTPDAWLSVGLNLKHSGDATGLLLPIYTTADEQFWLFYTFSKPARIAKSVSNTKIRGNWLDLKSDGSYGILNNDQVLGKNIIRTTHGPLYFECDVNLTAKESFHLPGVIRSVILATLRQSGWCLV